MKIISRSFDFRASVPVTVKPLNSSARQRLTLGVPFTSLMLLSGCATLEKDYIEPNYRPAAMVHSEALAKATFSENGHARSIVLNEEGQIDYAASDIAPLYDAARASDAVKAKAARNFLITQFMLVSDNLVERHKAVLLGNYAFTNAALSIATSAAGGLASILSHAATKSALGASAALFNSSRSTVNEQVFLNQLATSIVSAIDAERRKLRGVIEQHLAEETAAYSIDQAMLDLQAYHDAGSFARGLVTISETLAKLKETTPDIEARIVKVKAQYDAAIGEVTNLRGVDQANAQASAQRLKTRLDYLRAELVTAAAK